MSIMTPAERLKREAFREQQQKRHDDSLRCECGAVMSLVTTLNQGNETGYGAEYLFQCPTCKTINTRGNV